MPNPKQFKKHKDYLKWYREYREKNREKLRKYNREYQRIYKKKLSTGKLLTSTDK
jgi:hypothetical protein